MLQNDLPKYYSTEGIYEDFCKSNLLHDFKWPLVKSKGSKTLEPSARLKLFAQTGCVNFNQNIPMQTIQLKSTSYAGNNIFLKYILSCL